MELSKCETLSLCRLFYSRANCIGFDTSTPFGIIANKARTHWDNVERERLQHISRIHELESIVTSVRFGYKRLENEIQDLKSQHLKDRIRDKRKRCLAMARWCRARSCFYDTMRETGLCWGWKSDRAYKWYKKWLEFAEKFKVEG